MVAPATAKFRLLTVACDWLEFGVPAAAPPDVIVVMTPVVKFVVRSPKVVILADATPALSVPPAGVSGPVSASRTSAVIEVPSIVVTLVSASMPTARPLNVCACAFCVVPISSNNKIAAKHENVKKLLIFMILSPYIEAYLLHRGLIYYIDA